jgi:glutamate-ammonia-ligase adenylyltransferase
LQLSHLSVAIFRVTTDIVKKVAEDKFGKISSRFAVIGLGKFGSYDMNFASDLDVILIFEKDDYTEKGLRSQEYFSKLLQRIISFLSIRTVNGVAYEIDTRLRPSGNSGTLVTSLESFIDYHEKSSALWEILALLRSRFVVGDENFGKKVENHIKEIILSKEIKDEDVKEILRIRKRIEDEEGKETETIVDIKNGAGGILDIEFLVQILMLKNKVIEGNIFNAIKKLHEIGVLNIEEKEFLLENYTFLRKIENLIRLVLNKHIDKLSVNDNFEHIEEVMDVKNKVRKYFILKLNYGK